MSRFVPSSEQLQSMVRCLYPEAEIVACALFHGDHRNLNYDLAVASPRTDLVLKVYADDGPESAWERETSLLRMLTSETGVPVPRILYHDSSRARWPCVWSIQTRLAGRPLLCVIDELDPWQIESIGYEAGRYLAHLHQIPLDLFGALLGDPAPSYATEASYFVARAASCLQGLAGRKEPDPHAIAELTKAAQNSELWTRPQACLIHGAYTLANIIVEMGTADYHISGVLEFEHASAGSPEQDIAQFLLEFSDRSVQIERGLLDGYVETGTMHAAFWDRLAAFQALLRLEALAERADARSESSRSQTESSLDTSADHEVETK